MFTAKTTICRFTILSGILLSAASCLVLPGCTWHLHVHYHADNATVSTEILSGSPPGPSGGSAASEKAGRGGQAGQDEQDGQLERNDLQTPAEIIDELLGTGNIS